MGPKKKKANKAREEYLEKRRLDREAAAAAAKEQQQGEVPGGHGDQASAVICDYSDSITPQCHKKINLRTQYVNSCLPNRGGKL